MKRATINALFLLSAWLAFMPRVSRPLFWTAAGMWDDIEQKGG